MSKNDSVARFLNLTIVASQNLVVARRVRTRLVLLVPVVGIEIPRKCDRCPNMRASDLGGRCNDFDTVVLVRGLDCGVFFSATSSYREAPPGSRLNCREPVCTGVLSDVLKALKTIHKDLLTQTLNTTKAHGTAGGFTTSCKCVRTSD